VVDVDGPSPSVLLIKGAYDPRSASALAAPRVVPTGVVVFGGGTLLSFRDIVSVQCGDVTDCTGKNPRFGVTVGADLWVTRFLAAEAAYVRPANVKVTGSGDGYRFNSAFDAHLFTVAAKIAAPIQIVRLYGLAGANYHRATSKLSETIDAKTITVDDVQQTIPEGTMSSSLKTQGWGWLFGGGMEVWPGSKVALYLEANFARVKGNAVKGQQGQFSDRETALLFGLRFHIR
jgi:hypothetical protein